MRVSTTEVLMLCRGPALGAHLPVGCSPVSRMLLACHMVALAQCLLTRGHTCRVAGDGASVSGISSRVVLLNLYSPAQRTLSTMHLSCGNALAQGTYFLPVGETHGSAGFVRARYSFRNPGVTVAM